MLYGTNPSRSSGGSQDRDIGDDPIPGGLGATSPSRRPGVIQSGGGYGTSGSGSGGGPGPGEANVAGSRTASYKPVDRSASMRSLASEGKARYAFQKSGRGAKLTASEATGVFGLGDFFSDVGRGFQRAFTPPKHFQRQFKQTVTKAGRVIATGATGAGAGFIASGFNPLGAVAGWTYGLGKGIYGVTSNAPVGRTLYQTLAPAVVLGAGTAAIVKASATKVAAVSPGYIGPAGSKLSVAYLPAKATFATPGFATASTFSGAPVSAGSSSLIAASSTSIPGSGFIPPPLPPPPPPPPPIGFGAKLLGSTGEVLKAIGIGVGSQVILSTISKGSGYVETLLPSQTPSDNSGLPYNPPGPGGGGEAPGGGGEGGQGQALLASPGAWIAAGLAVGALYAATRKRRK